MNLEFLEQRVTAPGLFGDLAAFFRDLRGWPYWPVLEPIHGPRETIKAGLALSDFKLLFMTKGHGRRRKSR